VPSIVLVWDEITIHASIANRDSTIMIQFTTILSAYGHVTEYRSLPRRPLGRCGGLSRPSYSAASRYYNAHCQCGLPVWLTPSLPGVAAPPAGRCDSVRTRTVTVPVTRRRASDSLAELPKLPEESLSP
jgi:hypothetical protein